MEQEKNTDNSDGLLSLEEFVGIVQEYLHEITRNWKLIAIVVFLFGFGGLIMALNTQTTYTANLTFMVNDDEGGRSGGAISGLLGQFGFSSGSGGKFNLAKILELSRSRIIIQEALFEKKNIDGKTDFLANHIIKIYDYHEEWEDHEGLDGFLFHRDSFLLFNDTENQVLKILHGRIIGNKQLEIEGLLNVAYGVESSIINFSLKSLNQDLSLILVDVIYENLSRFYVEKSIEKQQLTYQIMKQKADSLLSSANSKQYQLLKFHDSNRTVSIQRFNAKRLQLERDVQILNLAYGEALKNVGISEFSLKNATPFFQKIDFPIPPLPPSTSLSTIIKSVLTSLGIGGFVAIGWIIVRKLYLEIRGTSKLK